MGFQDEPIRTARAVVFGVPAQGGLSSVPIFYTAARLCELAKLRWYLNTMLVMKSFMDFSCNDICTFPNFPESTIRKYNVLRCSVARCSIRVPDPDKGHSLQGTFSHRLAPPISDYRPVRSGGSGRESPHGRCSN